MKTYSILFFVLVAPVLLGWAVFSLKGKQPASVLDSFAQCLAEKEAVMYGADWCPHCQNEKRVFGGAFQFIPYVECPDDPQKCLAAGIEAYPTWIFPDGKKLVGEQGIDKLARESGCVIKN